MAWNDWEVGKGCKSIMKEKFGSRKMVTIVYVILLLIIYLYHIDKSNLLYHLGDEFGYWADAAFLAGYDWSGVASHNTYYSYGYSLFLFPLFIIDNFELRYQTALFINVIMQIFSFLLMNKLFGRMFTRINRFIICTVCAAVTVYSTNLFFAKTTLAETCLYFSYVLIVYLVYKIYQTNKIRNFICLAIMATFIFCVHMRAIGITVSVFLILLMEAMFNVSKRKQSCIAISIILVLGVFALLFKEYLISNVYLGNNTVSVNDFSGQTGKISLLFSVNGMVLFIKSVGGKLFYMLSATFLCIAWGILWMANQLKKVWANLHQKKEFDVNGKMALFLICTFVATVAISSLYMIEESDVIDHLIYGRYNEFIFGPFLCISLFYVIENNKNQEIYMAIIICIYIFITMMVSTNFAKVEYPTIREVNIAGIARLSFFNEQVLYEKWEMVIALKAIIIGIFFFLGIKIPFKYLGILFSILSVAIIWIVCGNFVLDYQLHYRENYYTYKQLSDYILENSVSEITYLLNENYKYFDSLNPDILQFMNPDLKIEYKYISNISLEDETIFFVKKNRYKENYFDEYILKATSTDFELYVKP